MATQTQVSRRGFLKASSQAAGALILGFCLPSYARVRELASGRSSRVFEPNAWLRTVSYTHLTLPTILRV